MLKKDNLTIDIEWRLGPDYRCTRESTSKRSGLNSGRNENLTHESGSKLRVTLGSAYWNLTSTLSASP